MRYLKKDKLAMAIVIGLVCIILVAVMFAQFRTIEETDVTGIETAREEELRTMLASWKTKYEETQEQLEDTNQKINEYKDKAVSNDETKALLDKELNQTNMLVGKTDVTGEGVVITLVNNEYIEIEYTDLIYLVNELKLAGAEAISINDKRIINMTDIVDVNGTILINEERVTSPYTVKVIGNQTYLSSALSLKNSGFIDKYTSLGKTISMSTEKNIKIYAYDENCRKGSMEFRYAREVE